MRRLLSFTLLIAFFGASSPTPTVSAQSEPTIERLEIALWPEFDRQAVLVIYHVILAENTPLPIQVSLPIPADVGEPHAVAWQNAEGQLFVADYLRVLNGKWAIITVEMESQAAQIEFYQELSFVGADKTFTFEWAGGTAVEEVAYKVQVPVGASNFEVTPPPDRIVTGDFNLTYHEADLGPLSESTTFSIEASYSKSDDLLSADSVETQGPFPTSSPVTPEGGTPDVDELLPYILGAFGLGLILLGGYFFLRLRKDQAPPTSRRRSRKAKPKETGDSGLEIDASPVFCHNCGTQASVSDHFCRQCGTPLRR
jgi:hypothetical protein